MLEWHELGSCEARSFHSRHMHFAVCNSYIPTTQHCRQRRHCCDVSASKDHRRLGPQKTAEFLFELRMKVRHSAENWRTTSSRAVFQQRSLGCRDRCRMHIEPEIVV